MCQTFSSYFTELATLLNRLRGEHYGTPADVFSLGIVMSELVSLNQPYQDHLKDEDGNYIASWDQVIHMTKTGNLRPTLPDEMDSDFKALIEDCWHAEPSLRPSVSVVLIRLENIGVLTSTRLMPGDELRVGSNVDEIMDSAAEELCRHFNALLWDYATEWDEEKAHVLIANDATVTARDPTLSTVLGSTKGLSAAKALGWMMFGGQEDGTEIRQEPVLETDIIVCGHEQYVLLKARFSLIAAAKIKQWRVKDTREFDALQAALAASEKAIESWGTGALGEFRAKSEARETTLICRRTQLTETSFARTGPYAPPHLVARVAQGNSPAPALTRAARRGGGARDPGRVRKMSASRSSSRQRASCADTAPPRFTRARRSSFMA